MNRLILLLIVFFTPACFPPTSMEEGLWRSENYDFLWLKTDTICFYRSYQCRYADCFIPEKENAKNYIGVGAYQTPCLVDAERPELGITNRKVTIQLHQSQDQKITISSYDPCLPNRFHQGHLTFTKCIPQQQHVAWDSVTIQLFTNGTPHLFQTSIHQSTAKQLMQQASLVNSKRGNILTLEQEVWLLLQKEHRFFYSKEVYHSIGKIYRVYHDGRKIAEKKQSTETCYFFILDKIAYDRFRAVHENRAVFDKH